MNTPDTDSEWEKLAQANPYWAVLTHDKFGMAETPEKHKAAFFKTGQNYVDWMISVVRDKIQSDFVPSKSLDFGCGVGRLVLPLSKISNQVTGVDVSESMLKEARKNAEEMARKNVRFAKNLDEARANGPFDFLNSFIVLQHIPSNRGIQIFHNLLELLSEGGIGVLHLTYSTRFHSYQNPRLPLDYQVHSPPGGLGHHAKGFLNICLKKISKYLHVSSHSVTALQDKDASPQILMIPYCLNPIVQILQENGVKNFHIEMTDHSKNYGVVLFFKKQKNIPYSSELLYED